MWAAGCMQDGEHVGLICLQVKHRYQGFAGEWWGVIKRIPTGHRSKQHQCRSQDAGAGEGQACGIQTLRFRENLLQAFLQPCSTSIMPQAFALRTATGKGD